MTYGIYSEDLKRVRCSQLSLEECRKFPSRGFVICSEREITTGLEVTLHFHGWRKPHHHRFEAKYELGFVSVECRKTSYTWADKIVERFIVK